MDTSYDGIRVTLPSSWQSLTDAQLYYVYGLIADNLSLSQMKAYCFFKFSGVNVLRRDGSNYVVTDGERRATVSPTAVAMAVRSLAWLDRLPTYPVRISRIKGNDAVDAALHGVAFGEYIALDNMYQGYLHGQDDSLIDEMAKIMYGNERLRLNRSQRISVFYWFASVKSLLASTFSSFLQPASSMTPDNLLAGGASVGQQVTDAMNAQIRALTKGDVTKEREVLALDTWRALTELDAQAKEYLEMKRRYGK